MNTIIGTYDYGSRITHSVKIEEADEPEDPTSLKVYQVDPTGTQLGPFTPTKQAQGLYYYRHTYTATAASLASTVWGNWDTLWIGTGGAEGSVIRRHYIASSRFSV